MYQSRQAFESYQRHADQLHQDFGVAVNRVNGDALCDLEPTLRSGLAGGWHFPNDAHLSPYDLIECLRRDLVESGCQLREQVAVKRFRCSGSSVSSLELDDGEFLTADAFVLTTGAEAAELGKMLDCNLPVVPGKGYSVTFDDAQGMPQTPMIFEADHVAVTPLGNSFRIGSTMQLTGYSRTIPKARIELLKRSAREHLRHPLPQANEQAWCGWRPMMPDGVPCIDRSPKSGNAFIASGNGMIGMATGPGTGQLVAELVLGRTPHIDPNPYRAGRFK